MALASGKEDHIVHLLLQFSLAPCRWDEALASLIDLTEEEREQLIAIADCNHVTVRALEPVRVLTARRADPGATLPDAIREWAEQNVARERRRIANAVLFLHEICVLLESSGCPVCVMKTLDHWPDFGSDLDLYTTADVAMVRSAMMSGLHAQLLRPSWGDRLAHKLNFKVPELPEAVEVHVQRLGQIGEHTRMARRFVGRRVSKEVGGVMFTVPAPEERIIVATLQRMYRHFFFRISDIVNSAGLVEAGDIDFAELKKAANLGGIWPGVCCYLNIVSGYLERYGERTLSLPEEVRALARFGAEATFVRARFIRVPVLPHSAELYTRQVADSAMRGNLPAAFRLTLLPPLACAAAVSLRLTGSDKGIW